MSLFDNDRFSYFKANISFLMPLNIDCHKSKLVRRNLDIYKPITEENSLVPYSKAFAIRKSSVLVT